MSEPKYQNPQSGDGYTPIQPRDDAPLFDWATYYVRLGFRVFPLQPRTKGAQVCRHGCKEATTDPQQISEWWSVDRHRNIGLATGDHFFVLDVDARNGGLETLSTWEDRHGSFPRTLSQATGGGGRQYFFRSPAFDVRNSQGFLGSGVDIRGKGGYVIAPPSVHPNGNRYEWSGNKPINQQDICAAPTWLLNSLQSHSSVIEGGRRRPALEPPSRKISYGTQHETLFRYGCSLRAKGFGESDILARLSVINRERCEKPGTEAEIRKLVGSICSQYAQGSPVLRTGASISQSNVSLPPKGRNTIAEPKPISIRVNDRELRDLSAEALTALERANRPPDLFIRGGKLVAVERDETGRHVIALVSEAALRGRLTRTANYYRVSQKGFRAAVSPPIEAVKDLLALSPANLPFPPLDGIVEAPVLRSDGSVLNTVGYDSVTRLHYAPGSSLKMPEVPDVPSADHLDVSKAIILDLLSDFPFVDPCSRANAVAALLTPVIKSAISRPTPLALVDATTQGTGKTLLAELVSIVATGRAGEMYSAPQEPDEWRKLLTTVLLTGARVVVLDNVAKCIDSPELARAMTADVYGDRLMRTNDAASLPVNCAWIATGNNVQVGGDMARRSYWIRMDAGTAAPHLRTTFRHKDIKSFVREHRGEILAALLTMARAWYVAGSPLPTVTPMGSFEAWTITIGGILKHTGIDGFLGNSQALSEQVDLEADQWGLFLERLYEEFDGEPFQTWQVWERVVGSTYNGAEQSARSLRAFLPDFLLEAIDKNGLFVRRLGRCFADRRERRFGSGEYRIIRTRLVHKVQEWRVVRGTGRSEEEVN